jgi:hypothetical protein
MTMHERFRLIYFITGRFVRALLPCRAHRVLCIERLDGWLSVSMKPPSKMHARIRVTERSQTLPTSSTCDMSMSLPTYRSKEELEQKLLSAIMNCDDYQLL